MDMPSENNNENKGGRLLTGWRLLALAGILCAVCLCAMFYVLDRTGGETNEFVPPPFDDDARTGTPEVPEELGWGELDAESYKFSVCGVFAPVDGQADVWLTNPEKNDVWLKLRVLDESGNTLGETGLIRPGEYVRSVALDPVPAAEDAVVMKIMAYEPDTYYSAGVVSLNTTVKGDPP